MPFFLTIFKGKIVGRREAASAPAFDLRAGLVVCEDTQANRDKYVAPEPTLTPRQEAAVIVKNALTQGLAQGAITQQEFDSLTDAWVLINSLLDLDKTMALTRFDSLALTLPQAFRPLAPTIREKLVAFINA